MTAIRVMRLITWLPVGGIERRLVSVLPRLRDRGFDVQLVCLRELGPLAEELKAQEIPVTLIPLKSRLDPGGIMKLRAKMKLDEVDIVHAHMYRASVPGTIAAKLAAVPVRFSQIHNVDTWGSQRQVGMDRFLTRWRTATFCVSEAVQRDVCSTLGLPKDKAPVLYNGSDTDKFKIDGALRAKTRAELGLDDNQAMVLVPARMHSQKNPIGMISAFKAALDRLDQDAVLCWAGDGGLREEIEAKIFEMKIKSNVRLLGKRDDMVDLYNAADLMMLSSFKEGFSNAVVEALACGTPVVASRVGGNAEAINSADVGWIHESGDGDTLQEQLVEALSDLKKLRGMAPACRNRGLHFSLDRLIDETESHYTQAYEAAKKQS